MESCSEECFHADLEGDTPQQELLRGDWVPKEKLQAVWTMGAANPRDVAWGRTVSWWYISPRIQQLFRDNSITGWVSFPIALSNKSGDICPGYSVSGRCGPIDKTRGQLAPGEKTNTKYSLRKGLYFDAASWDRSDFFCPTGNNSYIFVTARVREICENNEVFGFRFTPLSNTTWYP